MRRSAIAIVTLFVCTTTQAQVYRCADSTGKPLFQDHPCAGSGERRADLEARRSEERRNYNREYLDQLEHDRAVQESRRDRSELRSERYQNQQQNRASDSGDRRAVQTCLHDQKVDQSRSGRIRFTCDMTTGERILPPPRTIIIERGR